MLFGKQPNWVLSKNISCLNHLASIPKSGFIPPDPEFSFPLTSYNHPFFTRLGVYFTPLVEVILYSLTSSKNNKTEKYSKNGCEYQQ